MNGDIQTIRLYNLKIHSNGTPYDALADTNLNSRLARISPQRDKIAMIMVHSPVLEIVHIGERNSRKFLLDANPPPGTFDLDLVHSGYFGAHCATHFGHVVPPVSEVIVPV